MRGVITSREVLSNLGTIYEEFGASTVVRCLWAIVTGRACTFLEVALKKD